MKGSKKQEAALCGHLYELALAFPRLSRRQRQDVMPIVRRLNPLNEARPIVAWFEKANRRLNTEVRHDK